MLYDKGQVNREQSADRALVSDLEIQEITQDRLGRAPYAMRVAERIIWAGKGPSTVYGLAGPWGSGKTSFLNMVTESIKQVSGNSWSIVSFTPWAAGDLNILIEEFYMAVASAMPDTEEGNRAKQLLAAAAPAAAAVIKAAAKSLIDKHIGEGFVNDAATIVSEKVSDSVGEIQKGAEADPFIDRFKELSKAIGEANVNVLVIVDDVDRLHSDELLSVMKAVRLLGRFERVHYLLSYDEQTVIDVLTETDLARAKPDRARRYLEKIVQYPFLLPPIQREHLFHELYAHILGTAKAAGVRLPRDSEGGEVLDAQEFDTLFAALPTGSMTLRTIYRLCSQVDVMLTMVGGANIDLIDAILVTFLRLEYPGIYLSLPFWRRELSGRQYPASWGKQPSNDEKLKLWRERIRESCDHGVELGEEELIHRILYVLFPDIPSPGNYFFRSREASMGIRHDSYFERYFAFRVPVHDISDSDVRTELTHLALVGEWPRYSVIREVLAAGDESRRQLLRTKMANSLDVVVSASAGSSIRAAILLVESLPNVPSGREMFFGRWAQVIYTLLAHGISLLPADEAKGAVSDFRIRFGLSIIVDVLSVDWPLSTISEHKVKEASASIRDEVKEICLRDLTEELPWEERGETSIMSFFHYIDADLWQELQTAISLLIDAGEIQIADVAARFVSMSRGVDMATGQMGDRVEFHSFNYKEFELLIDREEWLASDVTDVAGDTVDVQDTSLGNRRKYAAIALRKEREKLGR